MENTVRTRSRVALVAQAIRKDLKREYPNTVFTVKSKNYSGGDSVDVSYVRRLTGPKKKDVEAMLAKYSGGHFDGMSDMYEYKSGAGDLTTKYLFIHEDLSAMKEQYKAEFMQYWGLSTETDAECHERTGRWFSEALSEYLRTVVLA